MDEGSISLHQVPSAVEEPATCVARLVRWNSVVTGTLDGGWTPSTSSMRKKVQPSTSGSSHSATAFGCGTVVPPSACRKRNTRGIPSLARSTATERGRLRTHPVSPRRIRNIALDAPTTSGSTAIASPLRGPGRRATGQAGGRPPGWQPGPPSSFDRSSCGSPDVVDLDKIATARRKEGRTGRIGTASPVVKPRRCPHRPGSRVKAVSWRACRSGAGEGHRRRSPTSGT